MRTLLLLLALMLPGVAQAADQVALSSAVFVERITADRDGRERVVLEAPEQVTPGDKLVFVLSYRNLSASAADDFTVTNPMPAAVAFQATPDKGAVVSIDGGRNWGALAALTLRERDGSIRGARPEDVTHIRWSPARAIPAGGTGTLSFRGVVR